MALIFQDLFTAVSDTELSAHTPDVGTSWTQVINNGGTLGIESTNNRLDGGSSQTTAGLNDGALYTADTTYSTADYEAKITMVDGDTSDDVNFIAVRIQDSSNMYGLRFNESGGQLYKCVTGTWTALGTPTLTIANGSVVTLRIVGTTLSWYDDGVQQDSVTVSDHSGAGKAGIGMGAIVNTSDDTSLAELDDFEVNTIVSGPTASITGTVTSSINEADIVAGGKTIIITLTGDTWVASGATFDAQRQNIINGIDSAQAGANGWDSVVKANETVSSVARTSDTVVTITLSAHATYNITAQETITVTIPSTAVTGGDAIVGSPTFTVGSSIAVSQTGFRFYLNNGSQSASTAAAAEDTDLSFDMITGTLLQLRIQLQETDGGNGVSTDDYQLQYSRNSGTWTNVTSSGDNFIRAGGSGLSNNSATTQRLTSGTGSFIAGEQSTDGLVDDWQITANNFSEHVFSFVLGYQLRDDDTVDLRLLRNGSVITYTEVPRITITRTANIHGYPETSSGTSLTSTPIKAFEFFIEATEYADKVSALIYAGSAINSQSAIYDSSENLVATSAQVVLPTTNSGLIDFEFNSEELTAGTYTLAIWAGGGFTLHFNERSVGDSTTIGGSPTYNTWPEPITLGSYDNERYLMTLTTTDTPGPLTDTRNYTTDSLIRKSESSLHNTNSSLRKANTLSQTTNGLLLGVNTRIHTADSLLHEAQTVNHSTGAYRRKTKTENHATDSVLRESNTLVHSTNILLRRINSLSHNTDSLLRKTNTRSHTSDSFLRRINIVGHSTDALLQMSDSADHSTDVLLRELNPLFHSTDATIRLSGSLSTDSFEIIFGESSFNLAQSTDALKYKEHTTDHATDANKRKTNTLTHSTDSLFRQRDIEEHTTDTLLRTQVEIPHTTDANKKKAENVLTHTSDSLNRTTNEVAHTIDSMKYRVVTIAHTTDTLKLAELILSHTTDLYRRRSEIVSHTTDSNRREIITLTHTTSAYLGNLDYSREDVDSLPTDDSDLATPYNQDDRNDVSADDEAYVCIDGSNYLVHLFKVKGPNNTGSFVATSDLKVALAPSTSTVYLQIYNRNTELWEMVDSDSSSAADTDFGLTASISDGTDYYDSENWVAFRIWQEII